MQKMNKSFVTFQHIHRQEEEEEEKKKLPILEPAPFRFHTKTPIVVQLCYH